MNHAKIIFAGSLLAMSILLMEINFWKKRNAIKIALNELTCDYFSSKRLELLLIHKIRPSEPILKVSIIENSLGDLKMVTPINWDNFFWAFRRAVTNPGTKLGLYLRENPKSPKYNGECGESAYISYQRLGSP